MVASVQLFQKRNDKILPGWSWILCRPGHPMSKAAAHLVGRLREQMPTYFFNMGDVFNMQGVLRHKYLH